MGTKVEREITLLIFLDYYWMEEYEGEYSFGDRAQVHERAWAIWVAQKWVRDTFFQAYHLIDEIDGLWNIETPFALSEMCLQESVKVSLPILMDRFNMVCKKRLSFSCSTFGWSAAVVWILLELWQEDEGVIWPTSLQEISIPVKPNEIMEVFQNFIGKNHHYSGNSCSRKRRLCTR